MSASRLHALVHRASRALSDRAARVHFRAANTLGPRAHAIGAPMIDNRGRLDVGDDFSFSSEPTASHIVVSRRGHVTIGSRVTIGSGAAIACDARLTIGDRVRIGRDVMILDTDFHAASSMRSRGMSAPIVIEDGAWIGDGAVVLKGARIGTNARIGASSVVSGLVPRDAFASGVPARVRRSNDRIEGDVAERVHEIMREVLERVDDATWDSLGALRLLVALEEEFEIVLAEDALRGVTSAAAITELIERAL